MTMGKRENIFARHCEGDSPKQSRENQQSGLLRLTARNDVYQS